MNRNLILALLIGATAAISWVPLILEPSLYLPWWIPLCVIALAAGLAALLSGLWLRYLFIAAFSSLAGLLAGYSIWPLADGIAQSYTGIASLVATLAVALVCLVTGLIGRGLSASNLLRQPVAWALLAGCAAFGPTALAARPGLIAWRVAHNNALAAQRFASLQTAVERARKKHGSASICDGQSLKENYSGPPFSDRSWRYIAGNYVKEDGYLFGIWINCSQPDRYIIDAGPQTEKADGTRKFCADQSGKVGCGLDPVNSNNGCVPCAP